MFKKLLLTSFLLFATNAMAIDEIKTTTLVLNGKELKLATVYGSIELNDDDKILNYLKENKDVVGLFLKSLGGRLEPAVHVGHYINTARLITVVSPDGECSSACAIMSVASKERYMFTTSKIGLHRVFTVKYDPVEKKVILGEDGKPIAIENEESTFNNAMLSYTFGKWGVELPIVLVWNKTSPLSDEGLTYINSEDVKLFKLKYKILKQG